jgi:hypothetical protein
MPWKKANWSSLATSCSMPNMSASDACVIALAPVALHHRQTDHPADDPVHLVPCITLRIDGGTCRQTAAPRGCRQRAAGDKEPELHAARTAGG